MKKSRVLSVVFLCLIMLCSCVTFSGGFKLPSFRSEYSEKEADEALHLTIERAVESTDTRFFQKLSGYNFVPEYYAEILEKQDTIPGMKKLIELWNSSVSIVFSDGMETVSSEILNFTKTVVFSDPKALVEESDSSVSQHLLDAYGEDLKQLFYTTIEKLDGSLLENIVKQYNAWIISRNYINKTDLPQLDFVDYKSSIAEQAYTYYSETLMMFEELYRTTPDPYTAEVCQKVFGIQ